MINISFPYICITLHSESNTLVSGRYSVKHKIKDYPIIQTLFLSLNLKETSQPKVCKSHDWWIIVKKMSKKCLTYEFLQHTGDRNMYKDIYNFMRVSSNLHRPHKQFNHNYVRKYIFCLYIIDEGARLFRTFSPK